MTSVPPERLVHLSPFEGASLAEEMGRDEAMLEEVEAKRFDALVRFWEYPRFAVTVGKGEHLALSLHIDNIRSDSLEVVRRPSAGGSVVIGPGNLNIALAARHPRGGRDIHGAYRTLQTAITSALVDLNAPARFVPPGDIVLHDRKISGTAQASRRVGFLVHSTLLVSMDTALLERYLAHPLTEPEYRRQRSHRAFVTTVTQEGYSLDTERLQRAIAARAGEALGFEVVRAAPPDTVLVRACNLAKRRYGLESWTRERKDQLQYRRAQANR